MGDLRKRQTWQAALAELVGTFFLALAALLTPAPSTALAVGLTLAAFVYALGDISGCNVNPAVTLALVVTRRLPPVVGVLYLAAQLAGAALARLLAPLVAPLPSYAAASAAGEVVGAGFLVLTVLAVSTKFVPKSGSGVAIGAALLAGLLTTRGVLNPAIALAMGLGGTPALWAPLAGALVFGPLALLYLPSGDKKPAPSADNKKPADPRGSGAARPWRPAAKSGSPGHSRTDRPTTFTARHK
jgi:aquaporin Z